MSAPQGLFRWPGTVGFCSGSYTLTQGITPSTCTLYVPPQDMRSLKHSGTLEIAYGSTIIRLPDCRLNLITEDYDPDRGPTWALQIVDRRWKWAFGQFSGYYNQRRSDGDTDFIVGTKRSPREIAALCLDAMGERNYDVRRLPDDARPEINERYGNPAQVLDRLCSELACVVCLDWKTNRVILWPRGVGAQLPQDTSPPGPLVIERSVTLDPPERPDKITVASAPAMVQLDLELEAVCVDIDGTVDLLEAMSYTPRNASGQKFGAWDIPFFNGLANNEGARDLAKQYAFKWYRIKTPIQLPKLPGEKKPGEIKDLARILPLLGHQLVTTGGRNVRDLDEKTGERFEQDVAIDKRKTVIRKREVPPMIFGIWYDQHDLMDNRTEEIDHSIRHDETAKQKKKKGYYDRPFEIDSATGIVKFADYTYRRVLTDPASPAIHEPAKLFLRIAVNVRDPETMAFLSYEVERTNRGHLFLTPTRYEVKDELALKLICQYDAKGKIKSTESNEKEVAKFCNYYLDAIDKEYDLKDPRSIDYAGFLPIPVDGAITQVTWSVDQSGHARTRASRNREEIHIEPSYKERRVYQRLLESLQQSEKPPAAKQKQLSEQVK